jgi:hypothetical protein
MKRTLMITGAAVTLACSNPALATNWLQVQGNESADAPLFKPFGFLQPTYTRIDAEPVTGLAGAAAAYNGQDQVANLVGPDLDADAKFQFFRARLGARGVLSPLSDKINYFFLVEGGRNAITAEHDLMVTDASLTFNFIPGARLRAGLFKVPTGEEALVAVHTNYPYVYFTGMSENLLVERQLAPSTAAGAVPAGLAKADVTSGGSGFRDVGIQLYDWFNTGPWELSYAAMLSNGESIDRLGDRDGNKDLTLRLQASYIFGGKGPNRDDLSLYVWRQDGERRFGTTDYDRLREGAGFMFRKDSYRVSGEYMHGKGMILNGPNPPFVGAPFYTVGLTDEARGWYLEGGWRFHPKWEVDLRHERFDRMTETAANERQFTTTTLGLQYFINPDTRVTVNYELRDATVSNPQAIPAGPNRDNALKIADNLGDRLSVQLTWKF